MAYRKSKTRTRRATTRRTATRKATYRRAANGGNQWSREEIAFMRKFYRNHSTAWIARQLGRTVYSVRYKASDLSIRKANPSSWKTNPSVNFNKKTRSSKKRWAKTTKRSTNRKVARRATTIRKVGRRTTKRRSR